MCAPSNLRLDPDVYTDYLMEAALFRLPRLIDEIDRKRAVAMVVSSGSTSAVHQAELTRAGTIDELFFGNLAGSLTKSDGVVPGLLASLGLDRITKMQDTLDSHVEAPKSRPPSMPAPASGPPSCQRCRPPCSSAWARVSRSAWPAWSRA